VYINFITFVMQQENIYIINFFSVSDFIIFCVVFYLVVRIQNLFIIIEYFHFFNHIS